MKYDKKSIDKLSHRMKSHKDTSITLVIIKELQRDIEDYVDNLRKSNDMFRKSQDEVAEMILDKIQKFKLKYLEGNDD